MSETVDRWTYEYENDTGPGDEGFWEWYWLLKDGDRVGRINDEDDAKEICRLLNAAVEGIKGDADA
jgi:hypothetical protein